MEGYPSLNQLYSNRLTSRAASTVHAHRPTPGKKKKKKKEREEKKDGTGKAKFGTVEGEEAGLTHDATVTKHEALPGGNRRCGDACSHQRARCQSQSSGPRERDIWHSASSVMRLLRRLVDED